MDTQIITPEFNEILGAFDQINDCMLVIDPETEHIINANESACRLYGYTKDEFRTLTISDISKGTAKDFQLRIYALISESDTRSFEIEQKAKNGSGIIVEFNPSVVTYNNRRTVLCAGRDITERKAMDERLKRSEEQYRMLVEGLNVVSWVYDNDRDNYVYVSPCAEKIFGYSLDRWFRNNFWFTIVHPDDRQWVTEHIHRCIEADQDYDIEYRILTKDGDTKWFRDVTTVAKESGNSKTLRGILIDITEKKEIENELREREERLALVFDNAPIGKSFSDISGKLLYVNKAFCRMMGYTKEELMNMDFQSLTHPDDIQRNLEVMNETLDEGKGGFVINKRYVKKDGSFVHVETHVSITADRNGNPSGFIAQVIDITEQKLGQAKLIETQRRLGALLNNLSDIIFYESDENGVFISENIYEMTGYESKEFSEDRGLFEKLIHPDDAARINRLVKSWRVTENEDTMNFEFRIRTKSGDYKWVEDHMFGITAPGRTFWSGFMLDITDRKIAELALKETQSRLATVLKNLPNVVFYETESDRVFVSDNVESMLGYTPAEIESDEYLFISLIHKDDNYNKEEVKKILDKNKYHKQQLRVRKKNGDYIWIEDHMYLVEDPNRSYMVGFMIDISDRKLTEQRLEETQMRLAAVLNNLPNVVFYENAYEKQFISENIMEMLGYPVEDFYNNPKLFDSLIHPDDVKRVVSESDSWFSSGAKGIYKEIFRIKRKSGEYIWLEDHMFRSQKHDARYYYSGVMIDITERKEIEDRIEQSLKEKELLIKEIHHRVKNNLQVVSSLLRLQALYIKDRDVLDMLLDSQNRVQSMALVHQKLYQSKDLAKLDLEEYISQLVFHIRNTAKDEAENVKISIDIKNITFGVDTAVPCGLIVNELITNSLKHAFPDKKAGLIQVSLKEKEPETYELVIEDNGVGLNNEIDFKNTQTLGLQLVDTLVNQLEGTINMDSGKGTRFVIGFRDIG